MKYEKNMNYEVVLTELAESHIRSIIHYIVFELGNEQAAQSVLDDMDDTIGKLSQVAGSIILQTARIYSKATGKSTLLAVCSRDSQQVLPVCSINCVTI